MCGIVGLWNAFDSPDYYTPTIQKMAGEVNHRGPEAKGFAQGENWALGHTRLAIIDLENGAQPLWNSDGTRVIIGNNEIYNAPELRQILQSLGSRFQTGSDTEVILKGWEMWGYEVFSKLNGMFAVAIVDIPKRTCVLARDPMGIKPLHYSRFGKGYAFCSEIKSLLKIPGWSTEPNRDAAHLFMNFRYVPNEETLFSGVYRLPPGAVATLDGHSLRVERYFELTPKTTSRDNGEEAVEKLGFLLENAVKRHLISDVEVASYLSGGIDSSLVTALASRFSPGIRTFCMGFGEDSDENKDAALVANSLSTLHKDLFVGTTPLDRFAETIWFVEEPKINCLQGYLLAEAVSKEVKVALSGLGGDELFVGYVNNDILLPMTVASRFLPAGLSRNLGAIQKHFPTLGNQHYFRALELGMNLNDPLSYYAILRNCFDHSPFLLQEIYASPQKHWHNYSIESLRPYFDATDPDVLNALLRLEARTKLVNDFLLTEDRVSMAHSLEVRTPLLDKTLVEYAFSLPSSVKYKFRQKKRLLKRAGQSYLPDEILNKKKWGFSFTPHLFFEKQLRDFARQTLTKAAVKDLGWFSWPWIERVLNSKPSPKLRWHYFNLWVMAGFHIWHDHFFNSKRSERA
ncbi:MAG: asparagine synthase (glutamine-hydrolyzing) [Bdellovibrionaceae bacterium]|nr:asparagine synthase (glutamine-hydrolyzing) [Pseudobdellovibrionaceae bacterium]